MNRIRLFAFAAALALLLPITALPQTQTPPAQAAAPDRLLGLLDKTGFEYRKAAEGVWVVTLAGKNIKEIDLVIQPGGDMVVVQTGVLVERKALADKPGVLLKILELNHEYDVVKFAIEADGLYARGELQSRLFDAEHLKYLINQVAVIADDAEPQLKAIFKAGQTPAKKP